MENSLKRKEYNIEDVAHATFLFVIFTLLFEGLITFIPKTWVSNTIVLGVLQFLIEAIFAFVAYIIAKNRRVNLFEATGMKHNVSAKMVGLAFLISLVSLVFLGDLTNVFLSFLESLGYKGSASSIVIDTFGKYVMYVVCLCVAPAIFEEMLFRGTILKGLKKYGFKVAVLGSAVIFMIMHGSPDQTIHQLLVGVIIGYIFYKTGNLWIGIIVHFFNNFISVTEMYVFTFIKSGAPADGAAVTATNPTVLSLILSLMYALFFAVIGYMFLVSLLSAVLKENKNLNSSKANESLISVDGQVQTVELSVNGQEVQENGEGENLASPEKQEKMSQLSKILLWTAGIILVGLWLLALIAGFK